MANQLYRSFRVALIRGYLLGEVYANPVNLRITMVGAGYVFDTTHSVVADLTHRIHTSVLIPAWTISNTAVVDAPDLLPAFTGVETGAVVAGLVVFAQDSVTAATRLIGFVDSALDGSLPFTITAPEFNLRWPGPGIFGI